MTATRVDPRGAVARPLQMRRVLLVGPPGSGKTSQGIGLAARLGVPHVSTGELLRAEVRRGSPAGRQADEHMRAGSLVPDWLVLSVLEQRLSNALEVGFLLDGYPRTLEQAQQFVRSLDCASLDLVIALTGSDEVAVRRLAARMVCTRCDGLSNDASTMRCPDCGAALRRRPDDDEQVVRARLAIHRLQTAPMLDFFAAAQLLVRIDGDRPKDLVTSDLLRIVG